MLSPLSVQIRKDILQAAYEAGEAHIPSAFSIVEILIALYEHVMKADDIFVLSKGHGCLALYAILLHKGLIDRETFLSFSKYGSILGGHPDRNKVSGVVVSSGSLGHGFPIAVGLALAKQIKRESGRVFCLMGDGECNEGSVWEAAILAAHLQLSNLVCIVDYNKSQVRSVPFDNLSSKFRKFGFDCELVDGHDLDDLNDYTYLGNKWPLCFVADTTKGKGIKQIEENMFVWHHKGISKEELDEFCKELDAQTIC